MATLVDIGRSLAASGITRLLFVNGHGGNSALGQVANRELRRRFGLRTFFTHPGVPVDQGGTGSAPSEFGMGVHGGHGETSLMLHLRPDLVRMDLARPNVPTALREFRHIGFGKPVSFGWTSDDFGPDGHIGDPTGATAEHGKRFVEIGGAAPGRGDRGGPPLRDVDRRSDAAFSAAGEPPFGRMGGDPGRRRDRGCVRVAGSCSGRRWR